MDAKLKKFLEKHKAKYDLVEHRKVYTAYDEAETQSLKAKEIAKTVLVKTDKELVLVVIPAAKNVDFDKVKKKVGAKKVSMAKETDITSKLKSKVGLIHPFGPVYKLPTLVDNAVLKEKKIRASAGSYTESIELTPKEFEKLVEPIKGSFSQAKK